MSSREMLEIRLFFIMMSHWVRNSSNERCFSTVTSHWNQCSLTKGGLSDKDQSTIRHDVFYDTGHVLPTKLSKSKNFLTERNLLKLIVHRASFDLDEYTCRYIHSWANHRHSNHLHKACNLLFSTMSLSFYCCLSRTMSHGVDDLNYILIWTKISFKK